MIFRYDAYGLLMKIKGDGDHARASTILMVPAGNKTRARVESPAGYDISVNRNSIGRISTCTVPSEGKGSEHTDGIRSTVYRQLTVHYTAVAVIKTVPSPTSTREGGLRRERARVQKRAR
jgi:hypothetical protein